MEKASLQKRLYSESNLYLAAYLAPSYVFNEELLCSEDRQILHALKDAYNEDVYQETIESVKMRLQKTMTDPNDYFHTEVYFKRWMTRMLSFPASALRSASITTSSMAL